MYFIKVASLYILSIAYIVKSDRYIIARKHLSLVCVYAWLLMHALFVFCFFFNNSTILSFVQALTSVINVIIKGARNDL